MKRIERKHILQYGALPILAIFLFAMNWEKEDAFTLLVQETLLIFGYFAALSDFRQMRVPNRLVLAMFCIWVVLMVPQLFLQTEKALLLLISAVMGAVMSGILFLLIYVVSKKGLGGGDVKLMTVSGLYLSIENVLSAMLYGSVFAAIFGIIMILRKKIGPRDPIPLVPFLYAGMLLSMIIQ